MTSMGIWEVIGWEISSIQTPGFSRRAGDGQETVVVWGLLIWQKFFLWSSNWYKFQDERSDPKDFNLKRSGPQARRIWAAENLQSEDLSAIEPIEAIVEIVDAELIEDIQYLSMGKTPADRMKTLLGKLDSVRRSKELGYEVGTQARLTSHKFVGSVEKIFKNLPKPMEWQSFYVHDLPILMDISEEVQEVSIQYQLSQKCSIGRSLL